MLMSINVDDLMLMIQMNTPLWERWENKQETVKTRWAPTWESYESNFEHISIQKKSKCEVFFRNPACLGGRG